MRISNRKLQRIIREEYSKLNRRSRRLVEGYFSNDVMEDAVMCVAEAAELGDAKQVAEDLFYLVEQYGHEPIKMMRKYIDLDYIDDESVTTGLRKFLPVFQQFDPKDAESFAWNVADFMNKHHL